jgi:hypothetical protein
VKTWAHWRERDFPKSLGNLCTLCLGVDRKMSGKGAIMGGYGSGRSGSQYVTTDGLLFLDIRILRKQGYFVTGARPGSEAPCSVA